VYAFDGAGLAEELDRLNLLAEEPKQREVD
jgi:hypothetical protein